MDTCRFIPLEIRQRELSTKQPRVTRSRTGDRAPSRHRLHDEFRDRRLTVKVGPVRKLPIAVSDMTSRGNRVVFEPQGSYVEHVASGERTVIENNGIYVMNLWVKKGSQHQNLAPQEPPPPTHQQIHLSTPQQPSSGSSSGQFTMLPQIPEGSVIRIADVQTFYRLAAP